MILLAACTLIVFSGSALTQESSSQEPNRPPAQSSDTPPGADQEPSTGSKITRKLKQAIPDCISIIFSTCKDRTGREQREQEKQEEQLARATKRCEELRKARPASLVAKPTSAESPAADLSSGESTSRTAASEEDLHPYCTPQDLLAAEHDVEVGDFNFRDKNYRGAEMRYRSALERLPGEPIATLHLARVLEKQGKSTEALELYRSYMAWGPKGKDAEEAQAGIKRLDGSSAKN